MKDRFKFRAWDTKTKKMIGRDFNVIGETTCFQLVEQYCYENPRGSECNLFRMNDIILMQSTGLKDKNGKLIYEGDFVEFKNQNPKIKCISSLIGIIEFNIKKAQFLLNGRMEILPDKIEVIGNIYENENLLTNKETKC